jgi:hypothetical protein
MAHTIHSKKIIGFYHARTFGSTTFLQTEQGLAQQDHDCKNAAEFWHGNIQTEGLRVNSPVMCGTTRTLYDLF